MESQHCSPEFGPWKQLTGAEGCAHIVCSKLPGPSSHPCRSELWLQGPTLNESGRSYVARACAWSNDRQRLRESAYVHYIYTLHNAFLARTSEGWGCVLTRACAPGNLVEYVESCSPQVVKGTAETADDIAVHVYSLAKLENIRDIAVRVEGVGDPATLQEAFRQAFADLQKHFDSTSQTASKAFDALVRGALGSPGADPIQDLAEWKKLTEEVAQITSAWSQCEGFATDTQYLVVGWSQQLHEQATEELDHLQKDILRRVSDLATVDHESCPEAWRPVGWAFATISSHKDAKSDSRRDKT